MELIRISTAGSVDDGKSTLIGRLLYDSNALFEDQIENIKLASKKKDFKGIDYSLFTDGLRDERSQGITIDVAHLYFSVPGHKFIIADTPGHIQYTRNMVTGMSNANIALILIDIKKGLNEQVKRHIHIARMLRIQKIIFCVNKMDLVTYEEIKFHELRDEFTSLNKTLKIEHFTFIPIAAIHGENVVTQSSKMPWYQGKSILQEIIEAGEASNENTCSKRMPIQCVINAKRDEKNYRGYAGMVASGTFTPGEEVIVLPTGIKSKIKSITLNGENIIEASQGSSIAIELEHEIDITRGDMIAGIDSLPLTSNEITSTICWMHEHPIDLSKKYILKLATRDIPCLVKNINSKYNDSFDEMIHHPAEVLMNDIANISIKTAVPVHFDTYATNKYMGRFILIDPVSNETVAAGIIE